MNIQQLLASTLVFVLSGPYPLFSQGDAFVLHDATPVRMRINRNVSSADAMIGETVDFEVLDDVKIGETVVIARGATAIATVTEAQKKRHMGRGGKLDINIDYVRAVNSDKIALRAVKDLSGGGHVGAMTGAIVATSLLFWPAAPFFLFMHGKDITIPKGTEITAYTNGEIALDPVKFGLKQPASAPTVSAAASVPATPALIPPAQPASSPAPTAPVSDSAPASSARPIAPVPMNVTPAAPDPASSALPPSAPSLAATTPAPTVAGSSYSAHPPTIKNTRSLQSSEDQSTATIMLPAPGRPLANADIIALKQAGFGDGVIISKIRATRANYQLEIKDLVALRKAGISDPVISAMIEAANR